MSNFMLLNGPNLNLLGTREPEIYGDVTLEEIESNLKLITDKSNDELLCFQSNAEHEIVTKLQDSMNQIDFIIINPGALTHTSIAIRDSLLGIGVPFYEVHISNIFAREEFRQKSLISDVVTGGIFGIGANGYILAINAMHELLKNGNR